MSFSKEIALGEIGKVTISEGGGNFNAGVQVSTKMIVNAGLDWLAKKIPPAASLIEGIKTFVDAEIESA